MLLLLPTPMPTQYQAWSRYKLISIPYDYQNLCELTSIWNLTSITTIAKLHGSLSSGMSVISQRRSILHNQLHNLFDTSLNIAKRSAKTKLAHQGGCHIQFIEFMQRIVSTPYCCIRCHSPATKPWSLLTKFFSLHPWHRFANISTKTSHGHGRQSVANLH